MNNNTDRIQQIDALLPQTQCDLCGYGGCQPYANAIVKDNAPIDRCPPGGVETLKKLATITGCDPHPLLADFRKTEKTPSIAVIDETACIGCTKCIQACPVDAIIGAAKVMHTVITAECTGCELCVAPCPVDCITIKPVTTPTYQKEKARSRFTARQQRLTTVAAAKKTRFEQANTVSNPSNNDNQQAKRDYIHQVLMRKRQQRIDTRKANQDEQAKT